MPVRIRQDSHWNVPEPELTLVVNCHQEIVGYCAGNDMSSRDIEGENPLYLPQAKIYDGSCALGPGLALTEPDELSNTGTGIVPGNDFSLQPGDTVRIKMGSLVLENEVQSMRHTIPPNLPLPVFDRR